MKLALLINCCLLIVGCSSAAPRVSTPQLPYLPEQIPLDVSSGPVGDLPNLNVSIMVFDSVNDPGTSLYSSAAQVRSAESRYLPYLLKRTLNDAGYWGEVHVMPATDPSTEVSVQGKIIVSDGLQLGLSVLVQDATNRVWLERNYYAQGTKRDYDDEPSHLVDPFQNLYNKIANDMVEVLSGFDQPSRARILDTAMLRYALDLAPATFTGYLSLGDDGLVDVVGLPARGDPIYTRVQRLRESEYLFAESVDAYYESLFHQLGQTYAWWRHYSYELIMGNRELKDKDQTRGASRGTWYAMDRIYHSYRESKMNEDALRELTASFDRETEPLVTEIAGKVVQLEGTAEFQYEEWRRILRDIYQEDVGF